jgi:NAD-dependent DNA ligase
MGIELDNHAQPVKTTYNYNRRVNRAINELHGFLKGIIADGTINAQECDCLNQWIKGNPEIVGEWPVNVLCDRLNRIYRDNVADDEERADLCELAREIEGKQTDDAFFTPTDLPLSTPEPEIVFDSNEFVLTGRFLYGTRKACEREIELRGGRCSDRVRLQTSYLVVGSLMSRDWKFTPYGNKILKAVEYCGRCPIAIVSEKRWQLFIN